MVSALGVGENIGRAFVRLIYVGQNPIKEIEKNLAKGDPAYKEAGERQGKLYSKGFDAETEKRMVRMRRQLDQLVDNKQVSIFADRVGRAFGKGSRNDVLNFFGSVVGNVTRTIGALTRFGLRAFDSAKAFGSLLLSVRSFKDVGSLAAIAGQGIAKMGPALAAAGVAGVALVAILGPLVATLSLMLGVVTALASSITFALVGAFGALLGVLLPVTVAVGVLAAGIAGLDDAQKKALKNSVKPLTKEFKTLADIAQKGLFKNIDKQVEALAPAFAKLRPLVKGVSESLSGIGDRIAKGLGGKTFDRFVTVMEEFLPKAVDKLGVVLTNTFGGLGGLLVSLVPLTDRFLDWLVRITDDFNEFTNVTGKRALFDFFLQAGDSASALGTALGSIKDLLGTIFTSGADTGDSIFLDFADKVKEFDQYLQRNPDTLGDWFADSKDFADTIGNLALDITAVIDALDSAGTRAEAMGVFDTIGATFSALADGINVARGALELIALPLKVAISLFTDGWGGAAAAFLRSVATILDGIAGLGGLIDKVIPGLDGLGDSAGDQAAKFRTLADSMDGTARREVLLKVDPKKVQAATQKYEDLVNAERIAAGLPTIQLKINDTAVKNANKALESALDLLLEIFKPRKDPKNKVTTTLVTSRQSTVTAIGGVFGGLEPMAKGMAVGGYANYAQVRTIGESGREAVVPLDRPLGSVDPSVRALSAFAQGYTPSGGSNDNSRTIAPNWTIITPTADAGAVAEEILNSLVAQGY